MKVGFCISGKGRLFQSAVAKSVSLGITPSLVILDDKTDPSTEQFCVENNLFYHRIAKCGKEQLTAEISRLARSAGIELMVLTFDKLLTGELMQALPHRVINIHPALLPSFKGFKGMSQALTAGVKYGGATIHEVDETLDGGPIIAQCITTIRPDDTLKSYGARLYARLHPMYLQVIRWYAEDRVYHDPDGRIWVKNADYSDGFNSPAIEDTVRITTEMQSE